jgi:hypothetical protein
MDINPNLDFAVSPILNDLRSIDNLEKIKKKLIFSSGSPKKILQIVKVVVVYI